MMNIQMKLRLRNLLEKDQDITHLVMVHCETTTGILNPIEMVSKLSKEFGKTLIIDAMSSFGGMEINVASLGIDFLISSANKCIQGVPGFGFVIAKLDKLMACEGISRSLSLDLYDQWKEMDKDGKWRYTSPTHVVAAFSKAIDELIAEGGSQQDFFVTKRIIKFYERDLEKSDSILIFQRKNNHRLLQLFFFQMNNSILKTSITL